MAEVEEDQRKGDSLCTEPPPDDRNPDRQVALARGERPLEFTTPRFWTDPFGTGLICGRMCVSDWRIKYFGKGGIDIRGAWDASTLATDYCIPVARVRGVLTSSTDGFDSVIALDPTRARPRVLWLSGSDGRVLRQKELPAKLVPSGLAGLGNEVLVARVSGEVLQTSSGKALPLRRIVDDRFPEEDNDPRERRVFGPEDELLLGTLRGEGKSMKAHPVVLPPGWKPGPGTLLRMWANRDWILRAANPTGRFWEAARLDGSDASFVAFGGVGACGFPLMGSYALVLEDDGEAVRALALEPGAPDWVLRGVDLDTADCVAGEHGIIAVTGRSGGQPMVAINDHSGWHRVLLPSSRSLLEPLVRDGRAYVSVPEEDRLVSPDEDVVSGAGAVYVLARRNDRWTITQRIVAPKPEKQALFGFALEPIGDALFINYFVDNDKAEPGQLGEPAICRAELSP